MRFSTMKLALALRVTKKDEPKLGADKTDIQVPSQRRGRHTTNELTKLFSDEAQNSISIDDSKFCLCRVVFGGE